MIVKSIGTFNAFSRVSTLSTRACAIMQEISMHPNIVFSPSLSTLTTPGCLLAYYRAAGMLRDIQAMPDLITP